MAEFDLVAVAKVRDELSGPMQKAAQGGAAALQTLARSDEQLAVSSQRVAQAKASQISAHKQAEFMIRAEADATNPLKRSIVELEARYAGLRQQIAAYLRTQQQVPPELVKSAGAMREKVERLKALDGRLTSATGSIGGLTGGLGRYAPVAMAAAAATKIFDNWLKTVDTSSEALADGVDGAERFAFAWKSAMQSGEGQGFGFGPIKSATEAIVKSTIFAAEYIDNTAKREGEFQALVEEGARRRARIDAEAKLIEQEVAAAAAEREEQEQRAITRRQKLAEMQQRDREQSRQAHEEWLRQIDAREKRQQQEHEQARRFMAEMEQRSRLRAEEEARQHEAELARSNLINSLEQQRAQGMQEIHLANLTRRAELEQKAADVAAKSAAQTDQVMGALGQTIGSGIADLIRGSATLDQFFMRLLQRIVEMAIQMAIMRGLMTVFGGGLLGGLFGGLLMAEGGFVTGGVPGRDSVPAMLMPGEYVMPVSEVASMRRFMRRLGEAPAAAPAPAPAGLGMAGGGVVPRTDSRASSGSPAQVVVNLTNQTTFMPGRTDVMRNVREVQKVVARLQQRGFV